MVVAERPRPQAFPAPGRDSYTPTVPSPFLTYDDAFAWLASQTNYETMAVQSYDDRTYGLSRVERLLDALGRPDDRIDVVQVVGSKGKGTAATALASILSASDRRTGLFTSPHLIGPRERIVVDGEPAPDEAFCAAMSRLRPLALAARARGEAVTFFELQTAAALLVFETLGCEAAVLEAGMGGRLDATSAAHVRSRILTSISIDHRQQLGNTRPAVAAEKAGAVRCPAPVICGVPLGDAVGATIAGACTAAGAPLLAIGDAFHVGPVRERFDEATGATSTMFTLRGRDREPLRLSVPLLGRHQAINAALAAEAALRTKWSGGPIEPAAVARGLDALRLPARFQVTERAPLVVVDGAHNPASASRLADVVRRHLPDGSAVFVVAMAGDKDVEGTIRRLAPTAAAVIGTTTGGVRSAAPERIRDAAAARGVEASADDDWESALRTARSLASGDGAVVLTGSVYLCGAYLGAGSTTNARSP